MYILLSHGIHFPTCFGLSKPSSGRIKHKGEKDVCKRKYTSSSNI